VCSQIQPKQNVCGLHELFPQGQPNLSHASSWASFKHAVAYLHEFPVSRMHSERSQEMRKQERRGAVSISSAFEKST